MDLPDIIHKQEFIEMKQSIVEAEWDHSMYGTKTKHSCNHLSGHWQVS